MSKRCRVILDSGKRCGHRTSKRSGDCGRHSERAAAIPDVPDTSQLIYEDIYDDIVYGPRSDLDDDESDSLIVSAELPEADLHVSETDGEREIIVLYSPPDEIDDEAYYDDEIVREPRAPRVERKKGITHEIRRQLQRKELRMIHAADRRYIRELERQIAEGVKIQSYAYRDRDPWVEFAEEADNYASENLRMDEWHHEYVMDFNHGRSVSRRQIAEFSSTERTLSDWLNMSDACIDGRI